MSHPPSHRPPPVPQQSSPGRGLYIGPTTISSHRFHPKIKISPPVILQLLFLKVFSPSVLPILYMLYCTLLTLVFPLSILFFLFLWHFKKSFSRYSLLFYSFKWHQLIFPTFFPHYLRIYINLVSPGERETGGGGRLHSRLRAAVGPTTTPGTGTTRLNDERTVVLQQSWLMYLHLGFQGGYTLMSTFIKPFGFLFVYLVSLVISFFYPLLRGGRGGGVFSSINVKLFKQLTTFNFAPGWNVEKCNGNGFFMPSRFGIGILIRIQSFNNDWIADNLLGASKFSEKFFLFITD